MLKTAQVVGTKSMAIRKKSLLNLDIRILIEVLGVILIWRGTWALIDRYLLPDFPDLSAIVSIALGIIILYAEHRSLQKLM